MKNKGHARIIIAGAGPAGISCALHLAAMGIASYVLDKAQFPRDKTCGDAISGNVLYELDKLGINLDGSFNQMPQKMPTNGIKFIAPNGKGVTLKMHKIRDGFEEAGYVSRRWDFDHFLVEQARKNPLITLAENMAITKVLSFKEEIIVTTKDGQEMAADMVVGADGAHSVIAKLCGREVDKQHYSAGLRQYWKGVKGFEEGNPIELHFYKNTLPGYLWVFALPNGWANVGIGIRSDVVSRKKLNIKTLMHELITTHPLLKNRFAHAEPVEEPKGYGLPLGSKKVPVSGERFILVGDAASLIDPFTGEGIGNAMISGRVAAAHITSCIQQNRFDAAFQKGYDMALYAKLNGELQTSYQLQKMLNYPWIFNLIVNKANTNRHLHLFLEEMLEDASARKKLFTAGFYYKLFFNPKR